MCREERACYELHSSFSASAASFPLKSLNALLRDFSAKVFIFLLYKSACIQIQHSKEIVCLKRQKQ